LEHITLPRQVHRSQPLKFFVKGADLN
jgi:hypothetical protein